MEQPSQGWMGKSRGAGISRKFSRQLSEELRQIAERKSIQVMKTSPYLRV